MIFLIACIVVSLIFSCLISSVIVNNFSDMTNYDCYFTTIWLNAMMAGFIALFVAWGMSSDFLDSTNQMQPSKIESILKTCENPLPRTEKCVLIAVPDNQLKK